MSGSETARGPAASIHSNPDPADPLPTSLQSLGRAVYDRRPEYVRPHRIRIKIGTWNVAACPGTDKDLAAWFIDGGGLDGSVSVLKPSHTTPEGDAATDGQNPGGVRLVGGDSIGLYVLGLQEIVDLSLAGEAYNRMYAESPMDKWRAALEAAMPPGYELVSAEQMSGLALLIYASPEVARTVTNVSTVQVGTGLLGYMGNKGAISTRVVLGETTRVVFVNSHLASGPDPAHLDRRCWDIGQVLSRTQFEAVPQGGVVEDAPETIGDEDFAFWFGDLNFRVDGLPGEDIRRLLRLHTQGEYDLSRRSRRSSSSLEEGVIIMKSSSGDTEDEVTDRSTSPSPNVSQVDTEDPSLPDPDNFLPKEDSDDEDFLPDPHEDPASLQATLDSLLPHDQLQRVMRAQKILHEGWQEAPITFLPTYKYDVGTVGLFDSSEKKRAPSWCDRILYRTRQNLDSYREKIRQAEASKKRDEEMKALGIDKAADDDDILFSYDPSEDAAPVVEYDYDEYDGAADAPDTATAETQGADRIRMEAYVAHQRITSSDHKPVTSVFTLNYDAAVPHLKAKVHAEVARELDRAENEGRPNVTVVVERQNRGPDRRGSNRRKSSGHEIGVDNDAVEFGDVAFLAKGTCSLTVANTGGVPASFSFVDKPSAADDGSSSMTWLTSRFISTSPPPEEDKLPDLGRDVTLQPGETVSVLLEALVSSPSLAQSLNYGRTTLEDVLVLRVQEGRDCFIPVRATWLPTSFSRSVEELTRIPSGGIRAFLSAEGIHGAIPYDKPVNFAAPRELLKLIEALESLLERAVADENMLEGCAVPREEGWPFDSSTWRVPEPTRSEAKANLAAALDTDSPLVAALPVDLPATQHLEILSEILLLFLKSLTDGLIPSSIFPRLPALSKEVEDTKTAVLDVLSSDSPSHNVSFVFLTATLCRFVEMLPRSERKGLSRVIRGEEGRRVRDRVAAAFAGAVFRVGDRKDEERARGILEIFLRRD
ncbi:related to inositol polyphosphate 5-phosphatase ocrl-1 [Cephalotrichum gorgonifer]|uniref:Related to inositol polyphosphate 5-phosphatase ocrl-1 n=1 Tax=Cephalotrichum gorgonifer TaxID=2041049 RepID=A0AAE8MTS6_9PEZI|nr:related to inositol polyphosphate 5-phosphatase ocrl-1 [Cephalotrichum gorgonifer]